MMSFKDYCSNRQKAVSEAGFFQNMFGNKAAPAAPAKQPTAAPDPYAMPQMPAKWNAESDGERDDAVSKNLIIAYLNAQKNQEQAKMKQLEQQIAKAGYTDRLQHQLQRCKQLFSKHNAMNRQNGDAYATFDCAAADGLR